MINLSYLHTLRNCNWIIRDSDSVVSFICWKDVTAACQCLPLVADVYGINFHKIPQRKRFENIIPFIFEFVNLDTYFSDLIAFLHVLFIHYIPGQVLG